MVSFVNISLMITLGTCAIMGGALLCMAASSQG